MSLERVLNTFLVEILGMKHRLTNNYRKILWSNEGSLRYNYQLLVINTH